MATLRSRLTARYAVTTLGALLGLSAASLVAHRSESLREAEARASLRADIAIGVVRLEVGAIRVTPDSQHLGFGMKDTTLAVTLANFLDAVPGFLLVTDLNGLWLYSSFRGITFGDSIIVETGLRALHSGARSALVNLADSSLVMVEKRLPTQRFGDLRLASAVLAPPLIPSPLEILGTGIVALPVILVLAVMVMYVGAERELRPFEAITTEVTAISDGRSLHRRLQLTSGDDEFARLTNQLNSMIARLETSFGALRRFTADASHELKTPLTVLRADVERAMHAAPQSTEQFVALEEALQEITRMGDLVESLLTLARADEGRFDLHREPLQLEPLVEEIMETALILGEDAGVNVTLPIMHDSTVLGDRTRLRQLFLNLVINALKYTPRGGDVELSLLRTEGEAVFSVRDTGIGIAAGDLPYVFERFWRADRARSRGGERGGFGLGLAIGQWIAQAHGGSLTVQSRLHRGSTFTVTLPLAPPQSELEGTPPVDAEQMRAAS